MRKLYFENQCSNLSQRSRQGCVRANGVPLQTGEPFLLQGPAPCTIMLGQEISIRLFRAEIKVMKAYRRIYRQDFM